VGLRLTPVARASGRFLRTHLHISPVPLQMLRAIVSRSIRGVFGRDAA